MSEECNRLEGELNRVAQEAEERVARAEKRADEVRRAVAVVAVWLSCVAAPFALARTAGR